jgi:membrane protein DedA with SNARE-associated domain
MSEFFQIIINWYMLHMSYGTVMLLMTIESTFLPMPSEFVIPPAAWLAAKGEMNIFLIIIAGTTGALIGSLINYLLSYFLGRKIVYAFANTRLAHLCMVTPEKIQKAEKYFIAHGRSSTFIGRLVPGVRHLISIPAGLAKMPLKTFMLFTFIGAGLWNIILSLLGYFLYSQQELLNKYFKEISYILLIAGILFIIYLIIQGIKRKKRNNTEILSD